MSSEPTVIVFELEGEPHRRRMHVVGPYASRPQAYDRLPSVIAGWIDDGDIESDELSVVSSEIAETGDGSTFGFTVYLADLAPPPIPK